MNSLDEQLDKAIKEIDSLDESGNVKFVLHYGSSVSGTMTDDSDIDLAIYYDCEDDSESSRYRFKVISNLFDDIYDIQIFQQLPLYVRIETLKGVAVYCKDRIFLYDVAWQTIKEFDRFKHRYYDYIGERCIV
ncbi:MAG TPA: nucleotidyltransferase domain-containing protein [Methanosarcinales archaeon]|nr:nucleotidyltransferase domain-containing protein [Methanosarcinales archaeon]